ncbi:hypothetical protein K4L44_14685 [Halosquirtibacter laminarini]|uniref:Uncharacterized protein n=1 Tax=Halosquirtibacter laminarini TaxID=3374600 RepID=A0AC61NE54_9BACT|nr:hypothetical protein K4L44_14685 [Prolixibacteraceae bacterium]
MNKRSLGLVGVLMVISLIISWFVFSKANQYIGTNTFNALPNDSPVILHIDNLLGFSGKLEDSELWCSFVKLPGGHHIDKKVSVVDSLLINNQTARTLFKGRPLFLSINKIGKSDISIQGTFGLKSTSELRQVKSILHASIEKSKLRLEKSRYNGYPIWTLVDDQDNEILYISFNHGLFIFSDHGIFLEQMIRQLIREDHTNEMSFAPFTSSNKHHDIQIFFNHKNTNTLFSLAFCGPFQKGLLRTKNFAHVTKLQTKIGNNSIHFEGTSIAEANQRDLISILDGQKPQRSLMLRYLPATTSYISTVRISDKSMFDENYKRYLIKNRLYDRLLLKQAVVKKKYGFGPYEIFKKVLGHEFGVLYTQSNQLDMSQNRFFWMDVEDVEKTKMLLHQISKKIQKIGGRKDFKIEPTVYTLLSGKKVSVYRSPDSQFGGHVLGYLFGSVDTKYYSFYKNSILFASSPDALVCLMEECHTSEKLIDTETYRTYVNSVDNYSNFSLFMRPRKFIPFWKNNIHKGTYNSLKRNDKTLMKFTSMGWTISCSHGAVHHEGTLNFDPEYCDEPSKIWSTKLDTTFNGKLFSVSDHRVKNDYRILAQDVENSMYMLSSSGETIWKKRLDGPILGKVQMVDLYRNGKVQYLFNSKDKVYLIDVNGADIENFPISLKIPASSGLTLVDYDRGVKKRIFVPTVQPSISVYSLKGRSVEGWVTQPLSSNIVGPVQHFEVAKKDYIVYSDREKTYLVDRRGRIRNDAIFYFPRSPRNKFFLENDIQNLSTHLVTSDKYGKLYRLFFDGSVRSMDIKQCASNHRFIKSDINLDGAMEYLYLELNEVSFISEKGVCTIRQKIKLSSNNIVKIVNFSPNSLKLGILDLERRKIHLLNQDGTELTGFPLMGMMNFVVGKHGPKNMSLDIVSSDGNGNIFKYEVN